MTTTTSPATRPQPRFDIGQVYSTPGILDACSGELLVQCLARHQSGDWGRVCAQDALQNEAALSEGWRIISAYPIDPAKPCAGWGDNTLWVITEADRSVTTFLLPSEY